MGDGIQSSFAWSAQVSADQLRIFSRLLGLLFLIVRGEGTSMGKRVPTRMLAVYVAITASAAEEANPGIEE